MAQRTFDIFLWFLVDCLEFKKNTWSYESNVRCGSVVELYQYRVIYGLPEGFCRSRIGAQECPDYSTMTERALHEKVWCSCCTQGLDNDMTALSFLNNCNCWNCHILFQTSYFLLSKPWNFRQGLLVTRFGSRYGGSVQRKQAGFEVMSGMVHSALAGIFKRSRSDRVVMFLVDGQNILPHTWQQTATS